jgi:hypothetical protein
MLLKSANRECHIDPVDSDLGRWCARIQVGHVRKYLGYFDTKEEASNCYTDYRATLIK